METEEQVSSTTPREEATTPTNGTSVGGRVRKTTQKFSFGEAKSDEADSFVPPVGSGTKLRDIPFVSTNISELGKKQMETTKALYSIMYGRRFQQKHLKTIKEQLLEFSGIPEQDDKARDLLHAKISKWKRGFVQEVMDLLGVDRSKKSFDEEQKPFDKDSLILRLIEWLYKPEETKISEKKTASAAKAAALKAKKVEKKAKAAKRKSTASEAAAKKKKQRTSSKKAKSKAKEEEPEEEEEVTESDADVSGDDNDSSSDFDQPKKQTKKEQRAPRKSKNSRAVVEDNDDNGSEEEETQEGEKTKPTSSTENGLHADIREKVREIIAKGDAEELTLKKIVRQLSEEFGRDLSSQKKAIKEFITEEQDIFVQVAQPAIFDLNLLEMGKSSKKKSSVSAAAAEEPSAVVMKEQSTQNATALADMFAQSQAFFGKRTSYVQTSEETPMEVQEKSDSNHETKEKENSGNATNLATDTGSKEKKQVKKRKHEQTEETVKKAVTAEDEKTTEEEDDSTTEETKQKKKKKEKKQKKLKKDNDDINSTDADTQDGAGTKAGNSVAPTAHSDEEKSQRTIFVGNVSLDATQKDLKHHFTPCGKVESVRLRFLPVAGCAVNQHGNQNLMMKVCANKKILSDKKDNCNAYVTFAHADSVEKALQLNGSTLVDKKIRVDREVPIIDPRRSVFVGNLSFHVADEKVWAFFVKRLKTEEEPDPVENVRLIRDRETGTGKGFGYVLLKNASLAAKALSLQGSKLENRELRVQVCGKRFKNRKGEVSEKKKYEGLRASAGAKARIQLKRKTHGLQTPVKNKKLKTPDGALANTVKPKKPKHAARKALQAQGIDPKKAKKSGDKTAKYAAKSKIKKPKHAARKARQAAAAAKETS